MASSGHLPFMFLFEIWQPNEYLPSVLSLFRWAFVLQSRGRNCSPASDLALWGLIFARVFFSGGVFFSQTPVWLIMRLSTTHLAWWDEGLRKRDKTSNVVFRVDSRKLASAIFFGKGQMGSALMGSLQTCCFLTEGLFGILPLTYFHLPKSARRTFFPNLSKSNTFTAAPLVLTPFVRNQIFGCLSDSGRAASLRDITAPSF